MKRLWLVSILLAIVCGPHAARAASDPAPEAASAAPRDPAKMGVAEISACMRANVVDRGSLREVEVQASDAQGQARTMQMKLFWKPMPDGTERMTLRVNSPKDVAGWSHLVVSRPEGDDVYLYMPAVKRVQRLVGGDRKRSLLGTDFTYAEIQQVQGLLLDGDTRRVADAKVGERSAFVLETATDIEETGYDRVRSYVDQATCTLLKAELFAKGSAPRKVLEGDVSTLVEVAPHWLILGYRMQDMATGTSTRLKLSDVFLLETLPSDLFDPASFYRVEP